jgi:peptide deformylase
LPLLPRSASFACNYTVIVTKYTKYVDSKGKKMAVLKVVYSPHPALRKVAETVKEITPEIKKLVEDMYDTMYQEQGVGLAANQVGISLRIFVMDVTDDHSQKICAINPEIISISDIQEFPEGCLSYPGVFDKVTRPIKLRFKAMDVDGKEYEMDAENLMARCVHHEVDHLNGKIFVDHLSRMKQDRARKKFEKFQRQAAK